MFGECLVIHRGDNLVFHSTLYDFHPSLGHMCKQRAYIAALSLRIMTFS
jgi:hypothetical protein